MNVSLKSRVANRIILSTFYKVLSSACSTAQLNNPQSFRRHGSSLLMHIVKPPEIAATTMRDVYLVPDHQMMENAAWSLALIKAIAATLL